MIKSSIGFIFARKKKIKMVLFLILGVCILASCGKNNNQNEESQKIEKSNQNQTKEIDFLNRDDEKLKRAITFYKNNKDKYELYSYGLDEYTVIFGYDFLYEVYLISFINKDTKFEPSEEKVLEFKNSLLKFDEKFGDVYRHFGNTVIPMIKSEMEKGSDESSIEIDKIYKEFIQLAEEKVKLVNEISQYYNSDEYKKDNFEKGKKLNDEYLKNYKETREKYEKAYNLFSDVEITLYNNDIKSFQDKNQLAKTEMTKARILLKMLTKEFYASDFYFEFITGGTAIKIQNPNYINNLKNIQKTLDVTIANMEKYDRNTIEKDVLNPEKYTEIVAEMK